ncbi:MAG: chromophore lyase CpcT/CpeT [Gloeomargarita sp. SKYG116]|nr:chromophore lyase CpcT/CpeT [Gloeomargarita sp. SKYG116]MDW8401724.1 chromophore lyase CpcT/CpeT [Gloeomargarita sp. SKYGB_i_bin116]
MSISTQDLQTLWAWLPGWYDNQAQAIAEPAWYVHLWLWHRVIPRGVQGQPALFIEQANALTPQQAYRQRVLVLSTDKVQYYACREPERWRGCGQEPARLIHLTEADLLPLPGCVLDVQYKNGEFHAQIRPGYRCEFEYQGQKRQVDIGWRVNPTTFISYDRGVDPQTGQALWGALMGPYIFQKRE